jgi:hypothetical protein
MNTVLRDVDVLDAIRDMLVGTNEFDNVYRSARPTEFGQSAGDRSAAVVMPGDWDETDESDDPTTVQGTRRVRWCLWLIVREEDPEKRERSLDQLLSFAQNVLDGQSIGGLTIAGWTRLRRGKYELAEPPEQRMEVVGEFAYYVGGFTGHDETWE